MTIKTWVKEKKDRIAGSTELASQLMKEETTKAMAKKLTKNLEDNLIKLNKGILTMEENFNNHFQELQKINLALVEVLRFTAGVDDEYISKIEKKYDIKLELE